MSEQTVEPPPTPIAPSSPPPIKAYPWRLCLARFFIRLIISAVIWISALVAALASALPNGYGRANLGFVAIVASLVLPMWALSAFLPRYGEWQRAVGGSRRAAYLALIVLSVSVGAAILSHLARRGEVDMRKRGADREAGIRVCSADLKQINEAVSVDSVLIEAGIVDENRLRKLLGERGLKFVELHAQAGQDWRTKEKTYGVTAANGDQRSLFSVAPNVTIVRVRLARKGDATCTSKDVLGLNSFMGQAPMAPDACLRVDFDEQSFASHALKGLPADANPAFIKWSLVEQASGKVLASLTSSDDALHPSRQGGGEKEEQKAIADDIVHCRSPHFSLMNLVYGTARKPDERLSLGQKPVTLDIAAAEPDNTATWEAIEVPELAVDDWNVRQSARHGPAWKDAYRIAQQSGWAGYAQGVIDFKAGVIATPRVLGKPDLRAEMRGSSQGFMAAWGIGANRVALAQFGLDGRLLWKRQIVGKLSVPDERTLFSLEGMEWDSREVRLYGFRQNAYGKGADVSVLKVPLSRQDGLPRRASLGRSPEKSDSPIPAKATALRLPGREHEVADV